MDQMTPRSLLMGLALSAPLLLATGAAADTRLVMLGTGTPVPDAERAGQSMAVVYDGNAYVFDAGGGMVQNAIKASELDPALASVHPTSIRHLFFTHLHSDHILDYPELAATLWWRRPAPLKAYGPTGLAEMTQGYYDMLSIDIELRLNGLTPVEHPDFYKVSVEEHAEGGWEFRDGDVLIEAFEVPHGDISPAFGYRVTTPDKVIVISGDTSPSEVVSEMASGADILVHEIISETAVRKMPEVWYTYHSQAHSFPSGVAKVANEAKPKLLVLTHMISYGEPFELMLEEVKSLYDGEVVLANDLDVF